MFRRKDRIPTPVSVELPPEEELPEDSLESVLEGLPTGDESAESTAPSDLPEEGTVLPEPDINPGHRKRKRKGEPVAEPLGDTLADERASGRRTFKEAHPRLRRFINTVLTMILLLMVVLMILSRVFASRFLEAPGEAVSGAMTPIQSMFAYVSNAVTGYFRSLKLRANLESEYNALRARNEELEYEVLFTEEYKRQVDVLTQLVQEMSANNQTGISVGMRGSMKNETGLDSIRDDEWPRVMRVVAAIAYRYCIDVVDATNEKVVEAYQLDRVETESGVRYNKGIVHTKAMECA